MNTFKKYPKSKKNGFIVQKRFFRLFKLFKTDLKINKSSIKEDIEDHFDFRIGQLINGSKRIEKIEVKSIKGITRKGGISFDYTWIEFYNVNGNIGWINGKSDKIAFEIIDGFLMVGRADVKKLVEDMIKDNDVDINDFYGFSDSEYDIIKNKTALERIYKWYRRRGRIDVIVLVPIEDIKTLKHEIIHDDLIKIAEDKYKQKQKCLKQKNELVN
jgi:hypothetical protein